MCARRSRPVRGVQDGTWCCVSLVSPFLPRVFRAACGGPSRPGVPYPRSLVRHSTQSVRSLLVVPACPLRVCALALLRRPPPSLLGGLACAPRAVPALGAGRAVPRGPCPSACPAPVPCSVWRAWGGGGSVPVPPYLAWGCGGGGRVSPGGVPSTVARGVWGQALPLPRLPAHWAGCWGPLYTCCGRGPGCGGPSLPPRPARPVGAACRGAGPWRSCAGGRAWGGGRARYPPFVRPGGACKMQQELPRL